MTPLGLQRLLAAFPPLFLLSLGSLASADAITGRVVDENGVGVAGVDIDVINLGSGGNPHEQNDGTDANGFFLTTIDSAGVFEVRFYAPPPPVTTHLTGIVTNVVVVGTKDMGTITLAAGVSTTGTVKNSANVPVANVKIDVFNATTGVKFHMKDNVTNAFGNFNVAVPVNTPLRTELLTSSVIGQVLVPRELFGTVTGTTDFGVKILQNGFHVTGTVRDQAGAAVVGADVDVTALPTGETLFTPSDNTNSLGLFDVVVPAGTYDLEVERPTGQVLVGVDVDSLTVSAATNVGVLTMRNGVFLSGTVRDRSGVTVPDVDVNVFEVATGQSIALGSDNTNLAGIYSVVVPTGLLDVVFSPPLRASPLFKDRHDDVLVTADTILDGRLPGPPTHVGHRGKGVDKSFLPPLAPIGRGTPGTGGSVPVVRGTTSDAGVNLWLSGTRPFARARLLIGFEQRPRARGSELHLVQPRAGFDLALDEHGAARLTLPSSIALGGRDLFAQLAVIDPEAPQGLALSHVLAFHVE